MLTRTRLSVLILFTPLALALASCGSTTSDGDNAGTETSDLTTDETDTDTADAGSGDNADEESNDSDSDESGSSAGAVGAGTVTIDGVVYPGFEGDCSISRGLDPVTYEPIDVGDLSESGKTVVIAIDNVKSSPEVEANFITTIESTFRMQGLGGDGTMDSISFVDSDHSGDVALVAFAGTTDDGMSVVAEVNCEIGLG